MRGKKAQQAVVKLPAEIKKRGVIMWQERFEEMKVMVDSFLIGYKEDFEIDKKAILKAPEDTYLWMLRETGTQLVNLTEVAKGEYKITDTALYFFYRQGIPFQMYIVNAGKLKRLTKRGIEKFLH